MKSLFTEVGKMMRDQFKDVMEQFSGVMGEFNLMFAKLENTFGRVLTQLCRDQDWAWEAREAGQNRELIYP